MLYHVLDEIYLHDTAFMDLAITSRGLRTLVYKKTEEPNRFTAVIDEPGDLRQNVLLEMKRRMH